jgi:hypothetical protein
MPLQERLELGVPLSTAPIRTIVGAIPACEIVVRHQL